MYFFADTTVNIRPDGPGPGRDRAADRADRARVRGHARGWPSSPTPTSEPPTGPGIAEIEEALAHPGEGRAGPDRRRAECTPTPPSFRGCSRTSSPSASWPEGTANVLIFTVLEAANAAYKLVQRLGGAEQIGPILQGMAKPVHVLQPQSEMDDVLNMTAIAVVEAGMLEDAKGR